jgi:hypothetical protein
MSQTITMPKAEVHCYVRNGQTFVTPKAILARFRADGAKPTIIGKLINNRIVK